jgi:lysophospholipase L1-like esterase
MKTLLLILSLLLNVVLVGTLLWVNERYGLWGKLQRVALQEGRVPGFAARHELNRNYQARREMFRLDQNKDAEILFIGDSQVSLADWNALLGAPLVANRGIEGDTTAGVLARLSDDADFGGETVILWIGTNDVLQGEGAEGIAARIIAAAKELGDPADRRLQIGDGGGGNAEIGNAEMLKGDGRSEMEDGEEEGGKAESGNAEMLKGTENRRVIVMSVAPMAEWVARAAERNLVVAEVNERLAAAAPSNGFTFVDLDPVLSDGLGYLRGDMTSDGVHLGAAAYRGIVEKLEEAALKR